MIFFFLLVLFREFRAKIAQYPQENARNSSHKDSETGLRNVSLDFIDKAG